MYHIQNWLTFVCVEKKLVNLKSDLNRNINHYSLEDIILLLVNR